MPWGTKNMPPKKKLSRGSLSNWCDVDADADADINKTICRPPPYGGVDIITNCCMYWLMQGKLDFFITTGCNIVGPNYTSFEDLLTTDAICIVLTKIKKKSINCKCYLIFFSLQLHISFHLPNLAILGLVHFSAIRNIQPSGIFCRTF